MLEITTMLRAERGSRHLNDQERACIIAFTEDGKTERFISYRLGIAIGTVYFWQTRFRET